MNRMAILKQFVGNIIRLWELDMQINVTRFYNEAAPMDYSASITEIGANADSEGADHPDNAGKFFLRRIIK